MPYRYAGNNPDYKPAQAGSLDAVVRHAEGEVEHSLCGMAFDAYTSGDSEEEIIFAKAGETVTCQQCRDHINFVRQHFKGYKYVVPNNRGQP